MRFPIGAARPPLPLLAWAMLLALPGVIEAEGPAGSGRKAAVAKQKSAELRDEDDAPESPKWRSLFDGKSLGKWEVIDKLDYARHGKVSVRDGRIVLEAGKPATGIRWTGPLPKINYEVTLEAMRVEGNDFFCALTFPVGDAALTLVVGGWRGSVVGLSSIDGEPAVENETCTYKKFDQKRWYRLRLRVAEPRIEVWIDDEKAIDLPTEGRQFSLYWEMEPALPFGVATWYTTGALRDVRVRPLEPDTGRRSGDRPDD